jgi:hypothetical protein
MKSIRHLLSALLISLVTLPGFASIATATDHPANDVITAYLQVHAALAADDLAAAKTAGATLLTAAAGDPAFAALTGSAGTIANAGNFADGRSGFLHLSQALIPLLKQPGTPELYLAHCPMAFGGQGGDWLQAGQRISNPYYGKSMLRCGVIKERMADGKPASSPEVDSTQAGTMPPTGHSRAELDRMHMGVPGYKSQPAATNQPAACGMSCCATKH